MNKRAVNEIVSTVLIVSISIVAIGIIATFIFPMIRENLSSEKDCSIAMRDLYIESSSGFTCSDENKGVIALQILKKNDEKINYSGALINIIDNRKKSTSYKINSSFSGGGEIFYLNVGKIKKVEEIELYPTIKIGKNEKVCALSSKRILENCKLEKFEKKLLYIKDEISSKSLQIANSYSLENELIAYWSFDGDTNTTAFDLSGNNFHGTYVNGAYSSAGLYGNAGIFDGVNDYIEVADNSALRFGTANFSVSFWIKTPMRTSSGGYAGILVKGLNSGASNANSWGFLQSRLSETNAIFHANNQTWSWTGGIAREINLINNTWNNVVMTRNGTTFLIYVNGVLQSTANSNQVINFNNTLPLRIAGDAWDSAGYSIRTLNSSIDEVIIFNKTLNSTEIQDIYNFFKPN